MASKATPPPNEPAPLPALVPFQTGLPGAAVAPAPASMTDWARVFAAVRRYKVLVASVTAVGVLAGLVIGKFLKPAYQAQATLWIQAADQDRDRGRADQGPIQSAQLLGTSGGWLDVIRSHVVLDDVVRRARLYLAPKSPADSAALSTLTAPGEVRPGNYRLEVDKTGQHFTLRDVDEDAMLQQGNAGDSVGGLLGLAWVPPVGTLRPGATIRFTITALSDAAMELSKALRIRVTADGYFVRLERRGRDPVLITTTVNAIADRLVSVAADLKRERITELSSILREQRDRAKANLRSAELALTQFRVRHAVRPSEGPAQGADGRRITADPTFASYVDLQVAIAGLARDREAITQVVARARNGGVPVDELTMIGAVQRSSVLAAALKDLADRQAELRALRFRYADTHPPVRRLAQQVDTLARYVIPELGGAVVAALAAREHELQQRIDAIAGDLRGAPPVALEEVRLARDQANATELFSNLEQRYDEARLAEVSTLPDVRILEHAIRPTRPVVNTLPLVLLLALVASLGAGVGGSVLLDRADPTIRDPQQVTRAMGLSILGAVPHVARANGNGRTHAQEDDTGAVEALRGIRLNVQHAYGAAGPVLITVTSPGRGDGKSVVTSNLALAFAQVGYRTLLIDGDVRCGAIHRLLKRVRRPGLTDVLADQVTADQVVQSTPFPQLSFIGAGSRLHRGPELLCSEALPRLISAMRPHYDAILVDSPPLAAGVDPCALASVTGSLLLVLRTGVTDRMIAEAKVQLLRGLPIRVLGVVLNDVRPGAAYSYYAYSLEGYSVRQEDPDGRAGTVLAGRS
ncbi:MAG TPA: polysaccharide biosynthesis tyrosine autokinase [Gemmatimonadales bacterium]